MKINFLYIVLVVLNLVYCCNIANASENQMTLTLQTRGKISIVLYGLGEVTIDWNDGTKIKTYTLTEKDLYRYSGLRYRGGHRITHKYKDIKRRVITITGENILRLDCSGIGLIDIDVSNNDLLRSLKCNNNQLTKLDGFNLNSGLLALECNDNQLISLNLNHNTKLIVFSGANNQLDTNALNNMFWSLHELPICKSVSLVENPGILYSDTSIALKKGWKVHTEYENVLTPDPCFCDGDNTEKK